MLEAVYEQELSGLVVAVNESASHYEMVYQGKVIAHHPKAQRHSVVMEPAHYHGLLKMAERSNGVTPPRFVRPLVSSAK